VNKNLLANLLSCTAIAEMLPSILNQLPSGSLHHLKERIVGGLGSLGGVGGAAGEEDDEVPALVENFDEASKTEGPTAATGMSYSFIAYLLYYCFLH
jgi:nascent polypeptide-associated complex subunit beta